MYLLYDLLLLLSALFLIPYYLLRGLRYGKSRRGIRERLGCFTEEQLRCFAGGRTIWVHAVSVGETRAAAPLLKALKQRYPDYRLLLTNVTETGHAVAQKNLDVDLCLFFPFDFSWAVRRVLQIVNPALVVIVETEIWPNFVRQAKLQEVPLALVNGRISDRSYPRYRFFRLLLRPVLAAFSAFCMQSQVDAERMNQLGADSRCVENTGNLKFDLPLREVSAEEAAAKKRNYHLPEEPPILVAGSTHAGEEKQLLQVYRSLLEQGRDLLLVLIPRHPERAPEVQGLLAECGFEGLLRSELVGNSSELPAGGVLLVDTLGEVLDLYSVADLVFVGGSLVPVGGHNPLEASMLEKPVLFGPHMQNFREISAKLTRSGAGIKVAGQQELLQQCEKLLDTPVLRQAMGQAGRALIVENAGATERTMQRIACLVKD